MKRAPFRQAGFTLLEIMLVVAIIMLLLGAAIYKMAPTLGVGKTTRVRSDLESLKVSLMAYEISNHVMPTTSQGLSALVKRPEGDKVSGWTQLMESVPVDAWGTPYYYENPGKHNANGYDLFSAGPDRKPNTEDDLGNWNQ